MVGLWMTVASLVAIWLWSSGSLRQLKRVPLTWLLLPLVIATVLCKSLGALVLLAVGWGVLFVSSRLRTRLPVLLLLAVVPLYVSVRAAGIWLGDELVSIASTRFDLDRGQSLQFRILNEDILVAKALQRKSLGWGRWNRFRVFDELGRDISVTDSLWVIVLGQSGLVGLSFLSATLLLPTLVLLRRYPVKLWTNSSIAPIAVLAIVVLLYAIDCLFNAMINPVYGLAGGAVCGLEAAFAARRAHARQRVRLDLRAISPQPGLMTYRS
jgi:hypothetical protein